MLITVSTVHLCYNIYMCFIFYMQVSPFSSFNTGTLNIFFFSWKKKETMAKRRVVTCSLCQVIYFPILPVLFLPFCPVISLACVFAWTNTPCLTEEFRASNKILHLPASSQIRHCGLLTFDVYYLVCLSLVLSVTFSNFLHMSSSAHSTSLISKTFLGSAERLTSFSKCLRRTWQQSGDETLWSQRSAMRKHWDPRARLSPLVWDQAVFSHLSWAETWHPRGFVWGKSRVMWPGPWFGRAGL